MLIKVLEEYDLMLRKVLVVVELFRLKFFFSFIKFFEGLIFIDINK